MNPRIRALAEQAGFNLPDNLVEGQNGPGVRTERDKLAEFAQLIVRECSRVAQMNTPDTEECEYTHLVSEKIKEHFGVEL